MKLAVVFGTRPEFIKLAPVILEGRRHAEVVAISTGQHKEMLKPLYQWFGIQPDIDLDLMKPNQSLAYLTSACIEQLTLTLQKDRYDWLVVQGDTTTCFASALAAFYLKLPVAHVEAGLRTWNKFSPWPEEVNRNLVSRIADLHLAPTQGNRQNLLKEGIKDQDILVTGNTVIDALLQSVKQIEVSDPFPESLDPYYRGQHMHRRIVLITGHRRENFGDGFKNICHAIRQLASKFPDVHFIYPVHMNPNVRDLVLTELSGLPNVVLTDPLAYPQFVSLMKRSYLILTDSGGVQEEAPGLGKPVLVMRENTERPEAVEAGTVKLVGTRSDNIVTEVARLLSSTDEYAGIANAVNPYGDGKASQRIIQALLTRQLLRS